MPTILEITPDDPNQEFSAPIDGTLYWFAFRFNERDADADSGTDGAWYMDIRETDRTPIAAGIKVVVGTYLGQWSPHEVFTRGVFVAYDTGGEMRDPSFSDLGRRVLVVFYNNTELVAQAFGS